MKKVVVVPAVALLLLSLLTVSAFPFSFGTHLYIAKNVNNNPGVFLNYQNMYGSMAPDLCYTAPLALWTALETATHEYPGYLKVKYAALTSAQKAFARGWITHNAYNGADYYAHRVSPITGYPPGYVPEKAAQLIAAGAPPALAAIYVEVAIDLLLENNQDRLLGHEIVLSAYFRDWTIPHLLVKAYPEFDPNVLKSAESAFRYFSILYGRTLALPTPYDKYRFADGIALLGFAMGTFVTRDQSRAYLQGAIKLCEGDYADAISETIKKIAGP